MRIAAKSYLILGIDPGTTLAAVFLDYETGAYTILEARGASLTDVLKASLSKGMIIAIATDKAKPPSLARKLKAITQSILITPPKDLTLEEKAALLQGREKGASQHVKDALAAALYAHAKLKQREAKERRRLAHSHHAFTPALFFKTPRTHALPHKPTQPTPLPSQHTPPTPLPHHAHPTHPPTRASTTQPRETQREKRSIHPDPHELRRLHERIAQLEHQLAGAEARAAYYAQLTERLLKEHAKPTSLDVELLKRIKPIGIKLPTTMLGRKGTPIRLTDLGITLYVKDTDTRKHAPRRKAKRIRTKTPSDQQTRGKEKQEKRGTSTASPNEDAYSLLNRILTEYQEERRHAQRDETQE